MRHSWHRLSIRLFLVAFAAALALPGCKQDMTHFREVRRIHDKVSESEVERYLRIVEQLPDGKLPELTVYRPLPSWNPQRTLPVGELLKEEQKLLERAWGVEWQTEQLRRNRHLAGVLAQENMTLEQFAGLTLAIGAALSRSQLRDDQKLDDVLARGRVVTAGLLKDERTFAKLTREERFSVHRKAAWMTRLDRASRLAGVPPENVVLVNKHRKRLTAAFPRDFLINPLDGIVDLLAEKGMPFEQLDSSGRDEDLTWDSEKANIGYDKPDVAKRR